MIVINKVADQLLSICLLFSILVAFYAVSVKTEFVLFYLIALIGVAVGVKCSKGFFYYFGRFLSKYCLQHLGDPLKKKTTMKKWCDQSWQLMIHFTMAVCEYYLLSRETWWRDTDSIWVLNRDTKRCEFGGYKEEVQYFFILQMAIWTYTALSCKYVEEVRKDYVVMMGHHVITVTLVAYCMILEYLPMGLCLLFLHDVSDVPLDVLKMVNYAKLGGKKGLFITEISFVVLLMDWFYFRIYLLPAKLLYSSIVDVRRLCPPLDDSILFPKGLDYYFMINALLVLLWFLHIWWGFLIIRLLVGIFTKGTHRTAEDEYEGESSDSDKEN